LPQKRFAVKARFFGLRTAKGRAKAKKCALIFLTDPALGACPPP
jgi:hypothetical protein